MRHPRFSRSPLVNTAAPPLAAEGTGRPVARAVDATRHLDPRVWLVWLGAVTGPALFARNPFPLAVLLIVVLIVRTAWSPALASDGGWRFILRFAIIAALISVVFNALTAPFGNQVLLALPEWWPFGDVLTGNAVLFGVLSAVAIVVIILAGTTAGLLVDWPELLRAVPARFLPLAVAGSVAWSFIPQTVATVHDIRDAQAVRGLHLASARTMVPLLVPLLATSLERATTMAEALESRGFGGPLPPAPSRGWGRSGRGVMLPLGLTLAVAAIYLLLDGSGRLAALVGALAAVVSARSVLGRSADGRSRYQARIWRRRDTVVLMAALGSLLVTGLTLLRQPDALRYSPYPNVPIPTVDIPFLLSLGLLLAPAAVAPMVASSRTAATLVLDPVLESRNGPPMSGASRPGLSAGRFDRRRGARFSPGRPWAGWPPRKRPARPSMLRCRCPKRLAPVGLDVGRG